mgnify:CR=1 FL=1
MAKRDFAFGKENFILIAVAVACIVLGFILMSGGGSGDNIPIYSAPAVSW